MATVRVIYCSKNLSRTRPRYVSSPRFQSSRKPSSLPRRNSESVRKFLARAIVLTVGSLTVVSRPFWSRQRFFNSCEDEKKSLHRVQVGPLERRAKEEEEGDFDLFGKWKKCVILSAVSLDTVFPRCTGTGSSLSPFRPFYFGFT